MRLLVWALRASIFFALFAFALNNLHEVTVHWFFGFEWRTSMVFIVLVAFAAGCAIGVLAMVPAWWRQRRVTQRSAPARTTPAATSTGMPSQFGAEAGMPPREGL
jgi:lipopolysaccharide assembly protein A